MLPPAHHSLFRRDRLFSMVFILHIIFGNILNKNLKKDSLHFICLTETAWKFIGEMGVGGILLLQYLSYGYGRLLIYDPC